MAESIRILLIEDEEIWIHSLSGMLQDYGYEIAGIAESFESAVIKLNNENYDLALVDVRLNGSNMGIELGKMINTLYKKPFIFITGSFDSHTVKEASLAMPSAYLIKPANPASLFISIQNALNRFENFTANTSSSKEEPVPEFLFVKQGNRYKKLFWKDIVVLTSDKNYTILLNSQDKIGYPIRSTLPKTLNWIIPEVFKQNFIQINRAEAIQIGFIEEINGENIKTLFGNFILGEAYQKAFKTKINVQS